MAEKKPHKLAQTVSGLTAFLDAQEAQKAPPVSDAAPAQLIAFTSRQRQFEEQLKAKDLIIERLNAEFTRDAARKLRLPVNLIDKNPWQPRIYFDIKKLNELGENIKAIGQLQPVLVRLSKTQGRYELVAGERRLRSHILHEMPEIDALLVEVTDEDMAILALAENDKREELSDYEIGKSLHHVRAKADNLTKMAQMLGYPKASVYRYLSYFDLPEFVIEDLEVTPKLLGSNASYELRDVLNKLGEPATEALKELWELLKAGKVDQTNLPKLLTAIVLKKTNIQAVRAREIRKLFSGAEQAGSITKDAKTFTLKLKTSQLSDESEKAIRDLIAKLYKAQ